MYTTTNEAITNLFEALADCPELMEDIVEETIGLVPQELKEEFFEKYMDAIKDDDCVTRREMNLVKKLCFC